MAKAVKENRGGARVNSGRDKLPLTEKKAGITVYVAQKHIDKYGGAEKLKGLVKTNIEKGGLKKL